MTDGGQLSILDYMIAKDEAALAGAQETRKTRAVRCPGCGAWVVTDERRIRQCGLCGRRVQA